MDKNEAFEKLNNLIGKDLVTLAKENNISIFKNGNKNKGWAGQTIERCIGLQLNTSRQPNLGSWELKLVACLNKNNLIKAKETIAITMIDGQYTINTDFENSHLFTKIQRFILVGREWNSKNEEKSNVLFIRQFELQKHTILFNEIKKDYYDIQKIILDKGYNSLSAKIGKWIQPRTKGVGHGSTTRAFYMKKNLLNMIIYQNFNL